MHSKCTRTSRRRHRHPIIDNGDGTASIHLPSGHITVIDSEDIPRIEGYAWALAGRGYVYSSNGKHKLHRLILQAPKGVEVDHINREPLDNRKSNLRLCTSAENKWNTGMFSTNTSGYRGVSFRKDRGKYRAYIFLNNRQIHLGSYTSAKEAAQAHDKAAREIHGPHAYLNFPDE